MERTEKSKDVFAKFGITHIKLFRWKKLGCPYTPGKSKKEGDYFNTYEIQQWLDNGGLRKKKNEQKNVDLNKKREGALAESEDATLGELEDMGRRIVEAEKFAHQQWTSAVNQNEKPTIQAARHKAWMETIKALKDWEKDYPVIMANKHRYRDINEIGKMVAKIMDILKGNMLAITSRSHDALLDIVEDSDRCMAIETIISDAMLGYLQSCHDSMAEM